MVSSAFEADLRLFAKERGINSDGKFLEETTLREYVRHVRRWHEATGSETPTLRDCRSYVIEMAETSPTQAQYAHRALKRYSHWLSTSMDMTDPLASWKMNLKTEAVKTPVASKADVEALLAVCDGDSKTGYRDHAIISVLAFTGMRRSECARMLWEHIDWSAGTILIPKTKTKRPRVVQMPTAAQKSLRRFHRSCTVKDGYMTPVLPAHVWWSSRGVGMTAQMTSNGIQQMLRERSAEAGVHVPAHSLRRFYAVSWLGADGSQAYLQKQAGWADGRMVSKYVAKVAEVESGKEALRIFG